MTLTQLTIGTHYDIQCSNGKESVLYLPSLFCALHVRLVQALGGCASNDKERDLTLGFPPDIDVKGLCN